MAQPERVKQLNKSFKLSVVGRKILDGLGSGSPAVEVSVRVGCSKANITYWKNKFLRMGAITKQTTGALKTYSITPLGLTILTGSEKLHESLVLEDYAMKFSVVQFGRGSALDWRKMGDPRNWRKMGVKVEGVRVVRTNRSLIIHPGKMRGFDIDELLADSGRVIERIRDFLERKFDIVLSERGIPIKKPVFRFYSDEAKEDVRHGTAILHDAKTGERLASTDNSGDVPHEEYDGKERALERLRMPDKLRVLERRVVELTDQVERMADAQEKTLESFNKILQLFSGSNGNKGEPRKLDYDYST